MGKHLSDHTVYMKNNVNTAFFLPKSMKLVELVRNTERVTFKGNTMITQLTENQVTVILTLFSSTVASAELLILVLSDSSIMILFN